MKVEDKPLTDNDNFNPQGATAGAPWGNDMSTSSPENTKSTDSTKNPRLSKKRKHRKSQSHQTVRKEERKKLLFELVEEGRTLANAVGVLCKMCGYKTPSTVYKWLKEDKNFHDKVLVAESIVAGDLEIAELDAAKGGKLTGKSKETEEQWHPNGVLKKRLSKESESYAPPSAAAARTALNYRRARLRKAEKDPRELERTSNPVIAAVDEEGNEIPMPQTVIIKIEPIIKDSQNG